MKGFNFSASALILFAACAGIFSCSKKNQQGESFPALNKHEITIPQAGGTDSIYSVDNHFIKIKDIRLTSLQKDSVVYSTYENPNQIIIDGRQIGSVSYDHGSISKITLPWCSIEKEADVTGRRAYLFIVKMSPKKEKLYNVRLSFVNDYAPAGVSIQ